MINGKNNTETNFVVGVTVATVYVAEERKIY